MVLFYGLILDGNNTFLRIGLIKTIIHNHQKIFHPILQSQLSFIIIGSFLLSHIHPKT